MDGPLDRSYVSGGLDVIRGIMNYETRQQIARRTAVGVHTRGRPHSRTFKTRFEAYMTMLRRSISVLCRARREAV